MADGEFFVIKQTVEEGIVYRQDMEIVLVRQ
jgi:hypothetical protein